MLKNLVLSNLSCLKNTDGKCPALRAGFRPRAKMSQTGRHADAKNLPLPERTPGGGKHLASFFFWPTQRGSAKVFVRRRNIWRILFWFTYFSVEMMSICIFRGWNDAQLAPSDPETSVLTHLLADSSGTLLGGPKKKLAICCPLLSQGERDRDTISRRRNDYNRCHRVTCLSGRRKKN